MAITWIEITVFIVVGFSVLCLFFVCVFIAGFFGPKIYRTCRTNQQRRKKRNRPRIKSQDIYSRDQHIFSKMKKRKRRPRKTENKKNEEVIHIDEKGSESSSSLKTVYNRDDLNEQELSRLQDQSRNIRSSQNTKNYMKKRRRRSNRRRTTWEYVKLLFKSRKGSRVWGGKKKWKKGKKRRSSLGSNASSSYSTNSANSQKSEGVVSIDEFNEDILELEKPPTKSTPSNDDDTKTEEIVDDTSKKGDLWNKKGKKKVKKKVKKKRRRSRKKSQSEFQPSVKKSTEVKEQIKNILLDEDISGGRKTKRKSGSFTTEDGKKKVIKKKKRKKRKSLKSNPPENNIDQLFDNNREVSLLKPRRKKKRIEIQSSTSAAADWKHSKFLAGINTSESEDTKPVMDDETKQVVEDYKIPFGGPSRVFAEYIPRKKRGRIETDTSEPSLLKNFSKIPEIKKYRGSGKRNHQNERDVYPGYGVKKHFSKTTDSIPEKVSIPKMLERRGSFEAVGSFSIDFDVDNPLYIRKCVVNGARKNLFIFEDRFKVGRHVTVKYDQVENLSRHDNPRRGGTVFSVGVDGRYVKFSMKEKFAESITTHMLARIREKTNYVYTTEG